MFVIEFDSKPNSCLSCPCLHTYANIPSETGVTFMARTCMAAHKEISVMPDTENPPDNWFNFPIPKFCPIKEIDFN